jgi:hypothetical protein
MKRKVFPALIISILIFISTYSYSQEIRFEWLNHINNIQEEWISLEKETFSIWNNISRFQDFKGLENRAKSLNVSIKKMQQVHGKDKEKYGRKYPDFFRLSSQYIISLEETITDLEIILGRLNDKTKDPNSYSWEEYSNDIDDYKKSVESYQGFGGQMNAEFKKLQRIQ